MTTHVFGDQKATLINLECLECTAEIKQRERLVGMEQLDTWQIYRGDVLTAVETGIESGKKQIDQHLKLFPDHTVVAYFFDERHLLQPETVVKIENLGIRVLASHIQESNTPPIYRL